MDIFNQEGATNAKWVWTINTRDLDSSMRYVKPLHPGGPYVDAVGIDGYNNSAAWWQSFTAMFDTTYDELTAFMPEPVWISEVGTVEGNTSSAKADWFRSAFLTEKPQRFPRVVAVGYWHQDNWIVNSSQASLDAYKQIVADARYTGTLP